MDHQKDGCPRYRGVPDRDASSSLHYIKEPEAAPITQENGQPSG